MGRSLLSYDSASFLLRRSLGRQDCWLHSHQCPVSRDDRDPRVPGRQGAVGGVQHLFHAKRGRGCPRRGRHIRVRVARPERGGFLVVHTAMLVRYEMSSSLSRGNIVLAGEYQFVVLVILGLGERVMFRLVPDLQAVEET